MIKRDNLGRFVSTKKPATKKASAVKKASAAKKPVKKAIAKKAKKTTKKA